jgi:Phytanoyl-CoA dioxygenase (PhyH)
VSQAIIIPFDMFDEEQYLQSNPDVAAAVGSGQFDSAYDHYFRFGFQEEALGQRRQSYPMRSPGLILQPPATTEIHERLLDLELEKRTLLAAWDANLHRIEQITFDMISESVADEVVPFLDRKVVDESALDADQKFWRDNGYLILRDFLPHDLIDAYVKLREKVPSAGGWSCPVPYMHVSELRDLSLHAQLMDKLKSLIGEKMGLHLNLTGWVSTERNWHQDDYLNPPYINSWYAAVWMALDDIHADSGPFEFVPGSHKWPLLRSHKVMLYLTPEERTRIDWPKISERFVNEIVEREVRARAAPTEKFIAKKGDLLIWHGRLMHRGSVPNTPGMPRKTLISHYSGISHRLDMRSTAEHTSGGTYFHIPMPLDYNPYDSESSGQVAALAPEIAGRRQSWTARVARRILSAVR